MSRRQPCVSQEARWSQDRNVGFVDIQIKEFIEKFTLGKDEQSWEMGGETKTGKGRPRGTRGK